LQAFERLIEKIKGWKRMQEHPISIIRGKILEFFSSYDTTDDSEKTP
jgi:hypothetical protein